MIRRTLALLAVLLPAACANSGPPDCTGPVRQLNVGRWTPGPNDLSIPAATGRGP